jgi:hypothetical protein
VAAAIFNTWNGDPGNSVAPRRPGLGDMGGATKLDDLEYPPDPTTMPTADEDNQKQRQIVAVGKVVPAAILSVHFTAGAPSVTCPGDNIVVGTFTVTDTATGDTLIAWPANTFPPSVADHEATATGATGGFATAQTLTNSARVRTFAAGGAAADINFNLKVY